MTWGVRGWRIAVVVLAVFVLSASAGAAAAIRVTTTSDPDINGTGDCLTTDVSCSLREAINAVDGAQNADTIVLPAGVYDLIKADSLNITASLTLAGAGASETTIKQTAASEGALSIAAGATVEIGGVTITGGHGGTGGGIDSAGTLTLQDSTVSGNEADGFVFCLGSCTDIPGRGGGIYSSGPLTIIRSAITGNIASAGTGAGALGGGIDNEAQLAVINSTIAENSAEGGNGEGWGGGIYQYAGSGKSLGLANVTVAFNQATGTPAQGGNLYLDTLGGSLSSAVQNSIIADGMASSGSENCGGGQLTSDGYNLEDLKECGLSGPGDQQGTSAELSQLKDSGGPTQTVALLGSSPGINGGNPAGCTDLSGAAIVTDQRGISRPQGGRCDVGAFEYRVPTIMGSPTISGRPRVGSELRCVLPHVEDPDGPGHNVVRWLRSGTSVAVAGSYSVRAADRGHSLTCVLQAENPAGQVLKSSGPVHVPFSPSVKISLTQVSRSTATFRFTTDHATGAQCSLTKSAKRPRYSSCTSPKTYSHLGPGSYTFRVRALGQGGVSVPAESAVKIT